MISRKTEIAVATMLIAILGAAILVYLVENASAGGGLAVDSLSQVVVQRLCWSAEALLVSAFGVGLFYILPSFRAQLLEHGKLHSLTDDLRRRSSEMEQAALTDGLTGLNNRRYFDEALGQYLDEFARVGRPVGLLILDLDHFKAINDTYGHDVGDDVLRSVSRCLLDFTRHHDFVARFGGEEFAVIVPNMNRGALSAFADRLRQAVERLAVDAGNVRLRITMSVGVAVADGSDRADAAAMMKRADVHLYNAKQAGRNRISA